jgi:rhamnosyltransferase
MTLVSIVILVKNAEAYLLSLMKAIGEQKCDFSFEVLAIDSGSSDHSLQVMSQYPVRVISIPPESFNHGETRNLGIRSACPESQYIVLLSQDALPANENWLQNLILPFLQDDQVAGVFSRHIPRPSASASVVRQLTELTQSGGQQRLVKQMPASRQEYEANKFYYIWFSNTSSAIRRSVWQEIPFLHTSFAEDAIWADAVLQKGYKVVFEPESIIIHSHDYNLLEQFRQNVDHSSAMFRLFQPSGYRSLPSWLKQVACVPLQAWYDVRFVRFSPYFRSLSKSQKFGHALYSPFWQFATVMGGFIGAYVDIFPKPIAVFFSRQERIRRL